MRKARPRPSNHHARRPLTPLVFAAGVVGVALFLGLAEVRNHLERPMMREKEVSNGVHRVVLITRGTRHRATDVFVENVDGSGEPRFVTSLYPYGIDRDGVERQRFEELRWTGDKTGVAATMPDPGRRAGPPLLWLFDMDRGALFGGPDGPADDAETTIMESVRAAKGGLGERICGEGDLSARETGRYLPVWRMRRYQAGVEMPPRG